MKQILLVLLLALANTTLILAQQPAATPLSTTGDNTPTISINDGDFVFTQFLTAPFATAEQPIAYIMEMMGSGSATHTSFTLAYLLNDVEVATKDFTYKSWGYLVDGLDKIPVPDNLAEGRYNFTVRVKYVDKKRPDREKSVSRVVRVVRNTFPRQRYLVEYYGARWCPNCPHASRGVKAIDKVYPDLAATATIIGRRDWPLTSDFGESLMSINNVTAYPRVHFNRTTSGNYINNYNMGQWAPENRRDEDIAKDNLERLEQTVVPALAQLQVKAVYEPEENRVNVDVTTSVYDNFTELFGEAGLTVYLVQDFPNLSDYAGRPLQSVVRAVLTPVGGEPLHFTSTTLTKRYSYSLSAFQNYGPDYAPNIDRMRIVAFVGRLVKENPRPDESERYVAQAEMAPIVVGQETIDITSAGYATLVLDKPWRVPEGLNAAIVSEVTPAGQGYRLALDHRYAPTQVVPAAVPVLLKGEEGSYNIDLLSQHSLHLPQQNLLRGNAQQDTTVNDAAYRYYVFTDAPEAGKPAGFYYQVADGTSVTSAPKRAYLALPQQHPAAQAQGFSFDGTVTAIITATDLTSPTVVYDLSGRRVHKVGTAGLYLINGKPTRIFR